MHTCEIQYTMGTADATVKFTQTLEINLSIILSVCEHCVFVKSKQKNSHKSLLQSICHVEITVDVLFQKAHAIQQLWLWTKCFDRLKSLMFYLWPLHSFLISSIVHIPLACFIWRVFFYWSSQLFYCKTYKKIQLIVYVF